jgi:hypothetical protein
LSAFPTAITIYPPGTVSVTVNTPPVVQLSIVEQLVTGSAATPISVQEGLGIDVAGPTGGAYTVSVDFAASGVSSATEAVRAEDSRLSDARTPLAHTHVIADVTGLQAALDASSNNLTKTARKASAGTITKGQVVYITGSSGTHLLVELADADTEATAAPTIGIAMGNITSGTDGNILVAGYLEGLSNLPVASFPDGASLWLSQTPGGWTTTPPTQPAHRVFLGWVVTNSNGSAGRAYIKVINGQELDELHDVLITGTTDGLPLVYENSTGLWKNKQLTSAGLANNSVGTNQLKDGEVTFAKLQDIGSGLILGRASVGVGDIEGLTLSPDFAIDIAGEIELAARAARSVLGNPTALSAAPVDITASADGQVLRRASGTLSFGSVPAAGSATQIQVNVGGFLSGFSTFTYDSTADRLTAGSIGLLNGEFIRNSVDGRIDFMPAPHPSGDYGIYFDLTTSANYALVGTIDSTGTLNSNAGFQFANNLAVVASKNLDFGNTGGLLSYYSQTTGNGAWYAAPYIGSGNAGAFCLVSQNGMGDANRRPATAHTNPTLYVYAGGFANASHFLRAFHDATDATLEAGAGKLKLKGATAVRIESSSGGFDLPATAGSNGQVLTTDGTNASWQTPAAASGASKAFAVAMAVAL